MSSRLYFQDDSIQLIELSSDRSSNENAQQSPSALSKLKKKNKIDSPTILSTNLSISSSSTSKISDIFVVKNNPDSTKSQFKPIPAPRKIKAIENIPSTSKENQENDSDIIGKSSETIDTISGEVVSQKSDTLSYKNKLRNRFLTVKKQAEISVTQSDKVKLKQKLKNAIEQILDNEDKEINAELNKREPKVWNENESSYDFFCKSFNDNGKLAKNTEENIENEEEIQHEEPTKQLVSEFLGISHLENEYQEMMIPYVVDYCLNESSIFRANKKWVRQIDENIQIRNFEDEGIYKNQVNHIPAYQLAFLEDRLFCDEARNWFNSDGTLNILPDPRLKNSCKPFESSLQNTDFINTYSPPTQYEPAENLINIYENTLEITLHNIKFSHHHLFSSEHVFVNYLLKFYEEYKKIMSENLLLINMKKLDALRNAKNRLDSVIKESGDCTENQMKRYESYLKEIKIIRENIYKFGNKERKIKKSILFIWKMLKTLRKTNKYSSTSIKLIITKETVDYNNEKQLFEQNLIQETNEILEELENEYQNEISEYKIKLKDWKLNSTSEKPKKPKRNFSKDQIESEILEKMKLNLKPPGEPNLDFEINYENNITENPDLAEKLRCTDVNRLKIFAKILYNNRQICKSKYISIDDNFICNFNEQFSIKLYKVPLNLSLQIFEQTNQIMKRKLFEVSLNLPERNNFNSDVENTTEYFENNEILNYNHSAVGTGINISEIFENIHEFDLEDYKLYTNGYLDYSVGWIFDKNLENIFESTSKDNILIPTLFDIENLENWIQNYPDPLDPRNSLFFDYIKNLDHTESEKNYFRLNPGLESLEFCSYENLENNPRFKLLKLRFNKEPEFKNIVVPNRVKEINEEIFSSYEKRKSEENISQEITPQQFGEDNSVDNQRKYSRRILEQAENRILQLSKISERKITLKDVLNEEIIPTFGSIGLSFMNWLQPKRPLRPSRKQTAKNTTHYNFKELNILVNIIGAIQVPNRKEFSHTDTSNSSFIVDQNREFLLNSVRPFVTVNFMNNCVKTTVAEGSNPIWNQELNLTLRNNNENFSICDLLNIQDNIIINLYDETMNDLILDDRIRDQNIHQHLGCNWIGNLEIPFKSLLENSRIEGTFKINLPQLLVGYERQNIKTFQETGEVINQKIDTFLTIFITLQPVVSNLKNEIKCDLECTELQFVEEFIKNWELEYHNLFPHRKFSCFVTTLNGEKCCLTRYFKEINLPPLNLNENEEITDVELTKYVSLIPFRENGNIGLINDIWLNPEQLLTLMMGTKNDHAVLLTCYFLTLGLECWFLMGYSSTDGYTGYVLVQERNINIDYFIYDVKSSKKCSIYDNNCPLQKVFCVVNSENIWANIQDDDRINQIRLDFSKTSDWLPLFNKEITAPSNLQPLNITYYDPTPVLFLQEKIEKKLRKKLMTWRKFSRTTFNHYCNAAFKKILPKLEHKYMREIGNSISPEHFSEIQNLLSSYQIRGFARSFPYTNIADFVEFLQETGIHLNDNPNIEFSLSVYAHSYNNNTVIIWLFVGTLVRKR